MKSVGKQLQEARLARNWTPELAARETKIKVDRLRDLENDDYSHFTSPTYARGFVRTYARSLGLDEYRILRQLDNKLPDDDSANIVTESGVAYLPETAMPPRAAHRDYTGLYIVMALGAVVTLAIVFVLFEAYRVGELSSYFKSQDTVATGSPGTTNAADVAATDTVKRALPVDSNTPPPVTDPGATTNAPAAAPVTADSGPRALPVDGAAVAAVPPASAAAANAPVQAVRALPVNPADLTNAAPATPTPAPENSTSTTIHAPPRALPVSPGDLAAASPDNAATPLAPVNVPPPQALPAAPAPSSSSPAPASARQSNGNAMLQPSLPAVAPPADAAPVVSPTLPVAVPVAPAASTLATATDTTASTDADSDKPLILSASHDSFVRVVDLEAADKPLYAAVLHSGHSIAFKGRKFSVNVAIPAVVDIKLDGVNYGPHSEGQSPETFTVQSHLP